MTLKELAKIAGVSISTVSKALNDSSEIGEKTKARIHDLAKLYNYQPNNIAVNLKTGKTKTIGVIVPSIQNNFFAKAIIGIEDVLNSSNYNIIISITNESHNKEHSIVKALSNGVVDGFIIAVAEETQISQDTEHFERATHRNKPIVLFDRVIKSLNYDKIIVDDKAVILNLTQQLIEKNKKAVALVSSIHNLSVGKSRKEGYLEGIKNHQDPILLEADASELEHSLKHLLANQAIDAIIALDEDASLFALKVLKLNKSKLPTEVALIGFAPEKIAEHVSPRLSTINQHGIQLGKAAAHRIIERLGNNTLSPKRIVINSTIDHRETT